MKIGLYGIVGWFHWPEDPKVIFGGYFKVNIADGSLVGELIDVLGTAKIEGMLLKGKLSFYKVYIHRIREEATRKIIHYDFSKSSDNRWIGSFRLQEDKEGGIGDAVCILTPTKEGEVSHMIIGPFEIEK